VIIKNKKLSSDINAQVSEKEPVLQIKARNIQINKPICNNSNFHHRK
jgi:hypothetical protein